MIPISVEVLNFGAIPQATLNFDKTGLAAVVGPNGAGKSTLVTWAPLFSLYGVTKNGCPVNEMVRTGESEMHVHFVFEHDGEVYRTMRTRSTKGRGKSGLEFHKQTGEDWENIGGASIAETQARIIDLLNLTADTFTSSSMILQNQSNEFTKKAAADRKDILSQIMGLEIYERLLELAKQKSAEVSAKIASKEERLALLAGEVEKIPAQKEELAGVEELCKAAQRDLYINQQKLKTINENMAKIEAKKATHEALTSSLAAIDEKAAAALSEVVEEEKKIADAQALLAVCERHKGAAEELTAKQEELTTKRAELQSMSSLDLEDATSAKIAAKSAHQSAELKLKAAEAKEEARKSLESTAGNLEEKKAAVTDLEAKKAAYDELAKKAAAISSEIKLLKSQRVLRLEAHRARVESLTKKVAILDNAECVDIENAQCLFLKDAKEAEKELESVHVDEHLIMVETDHDGKQSEWNKVDEEITKLSFDPAALEKAKKELQDAEDVAKRIAELSAAPALLKAAKESLDATAKVLEQATLALSSAEKSHAAMQELKKQIASLEEEVNALTSKKLIADQGETYRQQIAISTDRKERANAQILALANEKGQVQTKILENAYSPDAAKLGENQRQSVEQDTEQLQNGLNSARVVEAACKAELERLQKNAAEHDSLKRSLEQPYKEREKWSLLVKAYGRNGIPAFIIENAVPELERIANDILGRMSGGRHTIRFETQKETSTGNLKETLEIIVGDWNGERVYETFSGGEQLRIDLSIRFALAQLLASRAGSRVEWLTIDEGLSSQDQQHMDMVIESIKNVADMFKKVLVITHIESAKEAFGEIISVDVDENGGRVVSVL